MWIRDWGCCFGEGKVNLHKNQQKHLSDFIFFRLRGRGRFGCLEKNTLPIIASIGSKCEEIGKGETEREGKFSLIPAAEFIANPADFLVNVVPDE